MRSASRRGGAKSSRHSEPQIASLNCVRRRLSIVIRYNVAGKHARNRPSVYLIAVSKRLKLTISSGLLIALHFHVLRRLRRLRRDVVPIPAITGSSSGQRFNSAFDEFRGLGGG